MARTWRRHPAHRSMQQGQVLVLALALLFAGCLGLVYLFSAGQVLATKQRLTHAADAAAYSAALWRARVLNYHAYSNRAIVAQEVAIAQAVTLVAWIKYFETFNQNAGQVIEVVFPPAAVIVELINQLNAIARQAAIGAATLEVFLRGEAGVGYKNLLAASQEILQLSIGTFGLGAVANEVARANDPEFFAFVLPDEGLFQRFTKRYESDAERGRLRDLVIASLDDFVKDRPNDLPFLPSGCIGLSSDPNTWVSWVRKRGGTTLAPGLDRWEAADTLSVHDHRPGGGLFSRGCREREVAPFGWGAAEAAEQGEGSIVADPGNVRRNPRALAEADSEMESFSSYDGITRVRDLDYQSLDNPRFPVSPVAVLARVDGDQVRTAARLGAGAGRLALTPDFAGGRLWALSAAQVYFRRPPGAAARIEYASLYNPYWQARLAEPSAAQRAVAQSHVD